jgi:hypothetical protein
VWVTASEKKRRRPATQLFCPRQGRGFRLTGSGEIFAGSGHSTISLLCKDYAKPVVISVRLVPHGYCRLDISSQEIGFLFSASKAQAHLAIWQIDA